MFVFVIKKGHICFNIALQDLIRCLSTLTLTIVTVDPRRTEVRVEGTHVYDLELSYVDHAREGAVESAPSLLQAILKDTIMKARYIAMPHWVMVAACITDNFASYELTTHYAGCWSQKCEI